jgi:virulence-associated protein VapD
MCDKLKVFFNTSGSIAFKTRSISALLKVLDFINMAKSFSPSFSVAISSIILLLIRKKEYLGSED